jgi:hypothetical protein
METISTILSALFFIVNGSETCCLAGRAEILKEHCEVLLYLFLTTQILRLRYFAVKLSLRG